MKAIVLIRRNWREYDQIISFYTLDKGKVELLARGIKKITSKLSGYLTAGSIVEIEIVQGKELDHLIQVNPVWINKTITKSSVELNLVNYALGIIDKLVKVEAIDNELFYFLVDWLRLINELDKINNSLLYYFLTYILKTLGFVPQLEKCHSCSSINQLDWFDMAGGLICIQCYGKMEHVNLYSVNYDQVRAWKDLLNFDQIKNFVLDNKLNELIYKFSEYHLEKKITRFKI